MSAALVADIGGTYARFALVEPAPRPKVGEASTLRAEHFASVADAARAFLDGTGARPATACFAVAGPVTDDVVEFTNSTWTLDIEATRRGLGLDRLIVVNDFEALAYGVRRLDRADLVSIKPGVPAIGAPILLLGPGTGLGQALIVPCGSGERVVATEGGHVGFAPQTEEEIEILRFLVGEHGRVSVERVLSGPGLLNIHRALSAGNDAAPVYLRADDLAHAASEGRDPLAARALDLLFGMLGAFVGDAVLATGARGGVVLAGGILPKNREALMKSAFLERFLDKGRMRGYLEAAPIDLIVRDGAALLGAAAVLSSSSPPATQRPS